MDAVEAQSPEADEAREGGATVASAPNSLPYSSSPAPPQLDAACESAIPPEDSVEPPPEPSGGIDSMLEPAEDDPSSDEPPSDDPERSPKRQKLAALPIESEDANGNPKEASAAPSSGAGLKKSKKKSNNLWVTKSTRKGKKKAKNGIHSNGQPEETVLITPLMRFPDKSDDSAETTICLSKVYKAEKVELSEDRMIALSTKGYRMVRATRGVCDGAWYFEIKVERLGETGHTRLGWSMEKGDLQAPVGYDANSFGYRDIDGCKIHKALREMYGKEGYKEGDVIGFYISLPDGESYAPKPPRVVLYKGQRYLCSQDSKDDPPKVVPGSEISFFKNGVSQGVAFKDLFGGRYYPAASMYTLPDQPSCMVRFNFGPEFESFPENFEGRPTPRPMIEVAYHGFDGLLANGTTEEKKQ